MPSLRAWATAALCLAAALGVTAKPRGERAGHQERLSVVGCCVACWVDPCTVLRGAGGRRATSEPEAPGARRDASAS